VDFLSRQVLFPRRILLNRAPFFRSFAFLLTHFLAPRSFPAARLVFFEFSEALSPKDDRDASGRVPRPLSPLGVDFGSDLSEELFFLRVSILLEVEALQGRYLFR